MKSRRQAREAVLQALYQCDTLHDWTEAAIDLYFQQFQPLVQQEGASSKENYNFSRQLLSAVISQRREIEAHITSASTHWTVQRMTQVDRNVLRLATCEIIHFPDIPLSVSINEAIEVAKKFGSDDSPMFVNGVLDKIASGATVTNDEVRRILDSKKKVAATA